MPTRQDTEIVVIGAGVIGLAIAHRLAREGREVVILDPEPPGSGASFGNAGTLANYAVLPVGTPNVLRALPSLLFDRSSPLSIRPGSLISLAPWLARFARQSLPAPARRNATAIAALLGDACAAWNTLAQDIGGSEILQGRGCLYTYDSAQAVAAGRKDMAFRRTLGVRSEILTPQELAGMEPNLPPMAGGGAYFPDAVFMSDPAKMVARLADAGLAAGMTLVPARVDWLTHVEKGAEVRAGADRFRARRVILAAGAHSKSLARMAGDPIPLETERGYHVEWDMPEPILTRPVSPVARGFYLCPMEGRLRVAGTVELGGLHAPPSARRIAVLEAGARAIFPDLSAPSRSWMGFRPSMPDSLPVIGPSSRGDAVIHAFGHGHLGLTLAAVTARILSDLVAGRDTHLDIAPYAPGRFRPVLTRSRSA